VFTFKNFRKNIMTLWIDNAETVELNPNATETELQAVIYAVYRQVLGNAHVMESQRLSSFESLLRNGDITVRDFVRAVANSDLYRSLFFESSSAYHFIELNFKHLLGRAPQDQTEIAEHVAIYNNHGYEAEINSYLDGDEYVDNFGDSIVPYIRGNRTQTGIKNVSFNRTFAITRGFAANDIGTSAKLIRDLGSNLATKIASPLKGGAYANTSKRFRVTASSTKYARTTRSNATFEVDYAQLSAKIQSIQKNGGKISSITEIA
jgi:phycoerythrin-associated linker protein